jgi:integrase
LSHDPLCDGREQAKLAHDVAVERAREQGKPEPKPLAGDAERLLGDASVRNIMAPLRACLATAVREGVIRSNPARDIDLPHRPTAEAAEEDGVRAMSTAELNTLLALIPERHRLFFRFLAATGLRISEAIGLQWRHLQLDGSTPHVKVRRAIVKGSIGPPKTKQGRRDVPLDHVLVSALRDHRRDSEWNGADDPAFAAGNGKPLSPGNLYHRVLKPAREEACLTWVGFHAFRHTCASLLFDHPTVAVAAERVCAAINGTTSGARSRSRPSAGGSPIDPWGAHKVRPSPTPLSIVAGAGPSRESALQSGWLGSTPAHTAGRGNYDSAALTD